MSDTLEGKSKSGPAFGPRPGADDSNKCEPRRPASPTVAASANAPDNVSKAGLTSDEAQRQLAKFGPNAMPDTSVQPLAHGAGEVLGAGAVDARSRDRARTGARQICRSRDHRPSPGVQRRAWTLPGKPRPGDACGAEVAARADRLGQTRRRLEDRARSGAGAGRSGEAVAWRRGRGGCEAHGRRSSARPIHAHRRIGADRGRRRRSDLCGGVGSARRGGGGGHGDRRAHQVRPYRRTRAHRPCREFPAEGGSARGAQSRRLQRRHHRAAGGLFLVSQDAGRRDHPPRPDGDPGVDTGSAPGHLYPRVRARRAGPGKAGRSSDPPLGGG